MRNAITLACTDCKQRNYQTNKNKKNNPDRIEMMKYCKFCGKHTLHNSSILSDHIHRFDYFCA